MQIKNQTLWKNYEEAKAEFLSAEKKVFSH